jgi:hypothetical protein
MTIRGGTPPPHHFFRKDNPMGSLQDYVMQTLAANAMTIAGGVAAVAALVFALGMAKKLAAVILTASLNAGEWLAHKLAEKPKAVMLALSVFTLAIGGLWAWHTFTAPKIVEKPVVQTVTVPDEAAIAALAEARGKYGQVENARSDAETKAVNAEARAANEKARADAIEARLAAVEQAKKQVEEHNVALATKLRELSPPEGDDKALERLAKQIDGLHSDDVAQQAATIGQSTRQQYLGEDGSELRQAVYRTVPNPYGVSGRYRQYAHKYFSPATSVTSAHLSNFDTYYHRSCSICDHNCRIRQKMDEIFERLAAAEPANARLRDAAAKIKKRMDRSHLKEITWEVKRDTCDEAKYFQKDFKFLRGNPAHYHKDCATCEANHDLAQKIEELYDTNPAAFKNWSL